MRANLQCNAKEAVDQYPIAGDISALSFADGVMVTYTDSKASSGHIESFHGIPEYIQDAYTLTFFFTEAIKLAPGPGHRYVIASG